MTWQLFGYIVAITLAVNVAALALGVLLAIITDWIRP
jgi:hypothetical protein